MDKNEVVTEAEKNARHVMGVIVWMAIFFVFVFCGAVGWTIISIIGNKP